MAAEPGIGLQFVDQRQKLVRANDSFELQARAAIPLPDDVRFDPPDLGQANGDSLASGQLRAVVDHETLRGNVGNVQCDIANVTMFANNRIIDRMARRAA